MAITKETAEKQLDRIMGFFPRVDAKGSFLFALNTGMLAFLFLNLRPTDLNAWFLALPAGVAIVTLAASLINLYRSAYPSLKGGAESLIYFREIAKRTEAKYIDAFTKQTDAYVRDVMGQVWRNSEILTIKYDAVKLAFTLTAFTLIPWSIFLSAAAAVHAGGLVLK
ncbi:MAG: Pycsar system effector family protein [Xanthobacteraceae bacterium]